MTLQIKKRISESLVIADYKLTSDFQCPDQLWVKAATGTRTFHTCVMCGMEISIGQITYRPMGNPQNRSSRAHATCVEGRL